MEEKKKSINYNLAEFEFSAGKEDQLPVSDLPEIVFAGKSNVGKSSLINKVLNRKAIARVSSTPGKTTTINSFLLKECRFIDLPGYGYAKVSASEKQRWAKLIESYFNTDRNIKLVVQILDIRHKPSDDDFDMINYLLELDLPFIIACTKKDKLNKTKFKERVEYFHGILDEHEIKFVPVSSLNAEGINDLKDIIEAAVNE